jgi:hypothetical protein
MTFVTSNVRDNKDGSSSIDDRAAAISLWGPDLSHFVYTAGETADFCADQVGSSPSGYGSYLVLNTFTFDSTINYVVPRAVSYAAGLLNYFFRGSLGISLPPDGVYGVIEQLPSTCPTSCGFQKIKLTLTNTTANDALTNGYVYAVATFHTNSCYAVDLSSEQDPSQTCRSQDASVFVSNPLSISSLSASSSRTMTFTFPQGQVIPLNATNLSLQVVFSGQLGAEANSVAVGALDISEPTYWTMENDSDLIYRDAASSPQPPAWALSGRPFTAYNSWVSFGGPGTQTAVASTMATGHYARLAFLTNAAPYLQPVYYGIETTTYDPINVPPSQFDNSSGSWQRQGPAFIVRRGNWQQIFSANSYEEVSPPKPLTYCWYGAHSGEAYCKDPGFGVAIQDPWTSIQF